MTKFWKVACLVLSLVLISAFSQLTVYADEPDKSALFAGGSGTIDDPYLISNDEQLQNINEDLTAYYELTNDIEVMSSSFTPIGSEETPFTGVLNGHDYTVSNLKILETVNDQYSGLFRINRGTIKNINLADASVLSRASAPGILVGYNYGAIKKCSVSGEVLGYQKAGGLVCFNEGTISNCSVILTYMTCTYPTGKSVGYGGIAVGNYKTIENCFVAANCELVNCSSFGGIALGNNSGGTIKDSCSFINSQNDFSTNDNGGIVWSNSSGASIARCISVNTTDTNHTTLNGILKNNSGSVSRCYYLETANTSAASLGTKACSRLALSRQDTFSGFDFESAWEITDKCAFPLPRGIHVPEADVSISLSLSNIDMSLLDTYQLDTTVTGSPLVDLIVWSSSDESVATVDDKGFVTKTGYGNCEITATTVWGNKSASCNVAIVKSIEDCTISGITDKTYTGEEITQNIVVKDGNETIDPKYYTVTYKNNINVGNATVTIKGRNGFTDYVDKTFTINPREISSDDFEIPSKVFTGDNQSPEINTILSAEDYDASDVSESAVGSYDVTITGKGNCTGTVTVPFVITAKKLSEDMFTVASATYTGAAQAPTITSDLAKGTDYTETVDSAVNAGDYEVKITGKGNYSGTVTKTFTINPADISGDMFDLSDVTYTGSAVEPEITTSLNESDYTVKYSKNTNAGTATATITGKGNYTGSINKTFTINPLTIKAAMFTIDAVTYTGRTLEPTMTTDLKEGDYTVEYSNNINAGTGTATITGTGNCAGTATVYFTIERKTIAEDMFEVESAVYDGTKLKPTVTTELTENDYTVTYSNNTNAGKGTATIKGKGNYTGTVDMEFVIEPAEISASMFTVGSVTYTGEALTPDIETDLAENDYTVSFKNNTDVGTATATFKGAGNYTGTVNKTFKVNPASIKSSMFTVGDAEYTGGAIKPKVTSDLTEDDYDVEFEDNTKVGTGKAIISGKGNYTGSVTKTFTISAKKLTEDQFVVKSATFTGSPITPTVVTTLAENDDYIIASDQETNAGTYEITIMGKGNYTGTITKKFTINPASVKPSVTLVSESYTYDGKAKTPAVTVKNGDVVLEKDTDYTVSYASGRINAGNYVVTITLKGNYAGSASESFVINKAPNPLTVKAKTAKVKYSKVKKKAQNLAVSKVITFVKKGQGTMNYTKASGNKKIKINKTTGKVTIKKGLKKGKYKVKVKVKAAGTVNYNGSAVKIVTFTIRIN